MMNRKQNDHEKNNYEDLRRKAKNKMDYRVCDQRDSRSIAGSSSVS